MRGKGRNKSFKPSPLILNLDRLNGLPKGSVVDMETLAKHKLVELKAAKENGVKILGNGELQVALTVKVPVSKSASAKIEKAGGTIE